VETRESSVELRALDAEIARVLFGWTNVHQDLEGDWIGSPVEDAPANYRVDDFSSNPMDAKDVREEMRERGWYWKMETGCWSVYVKFRHRDGSMAEYEAPTEEEACARAAIAALAALASATEPRGE
jgi:hypothetical protein